MENDRPKIRCDLQVAKLMETNQLDFTDRLEMVDMVIQSDADEVKKDWWTLEMKSTNQGI